MDRAQSNRLRTGRASEPGRSYLITITCHQRKSIFSDLLSSRCFVRSLIVLDADCSTWCYVVMPDHVHWLMSLGERGTLSSCVQKLKSMTSRALHATGAEGPVWQSGFHDRALRHDEDLLDAARYIVANPLRAGLVKSLRMYSHWDACWL
ncbi:MAG: transposase [Gammaproteobacteria bacterium HGW-Gammaproteobacteria-5]|nr:MAG: transposase [Gammaproteobacteria bacterium HGW-Gammaproteobacteria-5]